MKRVQTKLRRGESGFTLVELAIVMIIIGLLITGVLKGQEMIGNAQVTTTVAGIKAMDAAASTFRDTFNSLPGDLPAAGTRLPNCAGACIGPAGALLGNGQVLTGAANSIGAVPVGEQLAFFMQLAAADLITGVSSTPVSPATVNFGDEVPESAIRGAGYRVGYTLSAVPVGSGPLLGGAAATWRSGHYLAIAGLPTAIMGVGAAGTGQNLTAIQATRIDTKLDDGAPLTGVVRGGGIAACVAAGVYASNLQAANCGVFIRIQG